MRTLMKYPWYIPFPIAMIRAIVLWASFKGMFFAIVLGLDVYASAVVLAALGVAIFAQAILIPIFELLLKALLYWLQTWYLSWLPGYKFLKANHSSQDVSLFSFLWSGLLAPVILVLSLILVVLATLPFYQRPQSLTEAQELMTRSQILWIVTTAYLYHLDCWLRIGLITAFQRLDTAWKHGVKQRKAHQKHQQFLRRWQPYVLTERELKQLLAYNTKNPPKQRKRMLKPQPRQMPKPLPVRETGTIDSDINDLKRQLGFH